MPTDLLAMRAAFMADIIANPEDDTPRLIFADWLDDNGEPERAEFIRVQCAIWTVETTCGCGGKSGGHKQTGGQHTNGGCAAMELRWPNPDGPPRARIRAVDLLEKMVQRYDRNSRMPAKYVWAGPAVEELAYGDTERWEYRRGFVAEIRCTEAAWLFRGPAIVREQPIEVVRLTDKKPRQSGNVWVWCSETLDSAEESETLPNFLYNLLRRKGSEVSREAACDRLSRACILWAKSRPV